MTTRSPQEPALPERASHRVDLAIVLVSQVLTALGTLVMFSLIGTQLGAGELGTYALALAIANPLFTVFGASLRVVYVTMPVDVGAVRILSVGVLASGLGLVICWPLGVAVGLVSVLPLVGSVKAGDYLIGLCLGVLQRRGHLRQGYLLQMTNALLTMAVVASGLLFGGGLEMVLILSLAVTTIVLAAGMLCAIVVFKPSEDIAPLPVRTMIMAGTPLGVSAGAIATATSFPAFVLAGSGAVAAVGAYSVLSSVRTGANVFFSAVAQAELHRLAAAVRNSQESVLRARLRGAIQSVVVIGLAASVALVLAGPSLLPAIFSIDLARPYLSLAVVACGMVAAGVTYVCDSALSSFHAYGLQLKIGLVCLLAVAAVSLAVVERAGVLGAVSALAAGLVLNALLKVRELRRCLLALPEK